jgi:Predicted SAM-dependent methyltransferase
MQLSKRLQAVADLVTLGNRVADIGCDHAYISIYLAEKKVSPHIIAMDINRGPICRAEENIIRYNCEDRVETRLSNGLERLGLDEADTIIIAGMGGGLTVQILTERIDVLKTVKELILQPQSELFKVRRMLEENEFLITEENMVFEDGKYYVMLKAMPQKQIINRESFLLTNQEHFLYGRLLLERRNPVLQDFLIWDLKICRDIVSSFHNKCTENVILRQKEIEERVASIELALKYYKR